MERRTRSTYAADFFSCCNVWTSSLFVFDRAISRLRLSPLIKRFNARRSNFCFVVSVVRSIELIRRQRHIKSSLCEHINLLTSVYDNDSSSKPLCLHCQSTELTTKDYAKRCLQLKALHAIAKQIKMHNFY